MCLERAAAKETRREEEKEKNEKEYGTKKGSLRVSEGDIRSGVQIYA